MPNAALDRGYFKGFRSGQYPDPAELTTVAFTGSWDLRRIRPHFFPRGGAVVFGQRTAGTGARPAGSDDALDRHASPDRPHLGRNRAIPDPGTAKLYRQR